MNRYKKLFSNALVFTISQFASKLLNFFLLPLYTMRLTTQDYGISDLINSTVSNLLIPIITLMIANAVLRFSIEKNTDRREVFQIGFGVTLSGCALLVCFYFRLRKIEALKPYLMLFYLTYIAYAFDAFWDNFAKGIDRVKVVAVTGVIKTVLVIGFNLLFLVVFHMGVGGYLLSYILALFLADLFLAVNIRFWDYVTFNKMNRHLLKQMLIFSVPLIPGSISWWINSTVNKYIVTYICGISALGLFSVASKIPSIISIVQSLFVQALVLSVIETYEEAPQTRDQFYTELYYLYFFILSASASILTMLTRVLAAMLFANDFYDAWRFVPFLLIGSVFGAMSGYLGTFYSASKETKGIFISTLMGAIASVILNLFLVPLLGIMGASIANCISTGLIWLYRMVGTRRYVKLKVSPLYHIFSCGILVVQGTALIVAKNTRYLYLFEMILFFLLLAMNLKNIVFLKHKFKETIKKE